MPGALLLKLLIAQRLRLTTGRTCTATPLARRTLDLLLLGVKREFGLLCATAKTILGVLR